MCGEVWLSGIVSAQQSSIPITTKNIHLTIFNFNEDAHPCTPSVALKVP